MTPLALSFNIHWKLRLDLKVLNLLCWKNCTKIAYKQNFKDELILNGLQDLRSTKQEGKRGNYRSHASEFRSLLFLQLDSMSIGDRI
jgi:hypothetical protein